MRILYRIAIGLASILLLLMPSSGHAREAQTPGQPRLAHVRTVGTTVGNSAPRHSLASLPDDIYWDDRFSPLGVNGAVYAIAVSGNNVYVGGSFTVVGSVIANGIARWDGSNWSALGSGLGGGFASVYSVAVSGNDVYAGGSFVTAGGVLASNIARWDGTAWSALADGVDSPVYAIVASGSTVYVGGYFATAGSISANSIAKWDGSTWSPLGNGITGGDFFSRPTVTAIAVSGSDVYAGGRFTRAGDVGANNIAKWNVSTNVWSALDKGIGGGTPFTAVLAIGVSGSIVYVGGNFTAAGSTSVSHIAKWDGNSWSALGGGVGGFSFATAVYAIAVNGDSVYVGGSFITAGNTSASSIAKWDVSMSSWSALSSGVVQSGSASVYAIAANDTSVYVGGYFNIAGNQPASHIARWNGSGWSALSAGANNGVSGTIRAIATSGNIVYVGGTFATVGNVAANNIARWNVSTNNWSALGSGVDGTVYAIAVSGNDVYVGGGFATAGGVNANNVAKWNGNNWASLGDGVGSEVYAIAVSGTDVYAGGSFAVAGNASASHIARWDGNVWSALGSGLGGGIGTKYYYPAVYAISISGADVLVGGHFGVAGDVGANHIAKWSRQSWSRLGTGVDDLYGYVAAIAVSGSDVYIGGGFYSVSGVSARNIAKWNGSGWSALGSGVDSGVNAIVADRNNAYTGGYFSTAGGASVSNIAQWNGCGWQALGSGVDNRVYALARSGDDVYVGGSFTTAGGKPSSYFARWTKPAVATTCRYFYFPFISK